MTKLYWIGVLSLANLGCDSLFGSHTPAVPATAAFLNPTVSFPSGLDCSAGGAPPLSVTWSVKPVMLQPGSSGVVSGFSATENLQNSGGSATDCYYTPVNGFSEASGMGLQAGLWQISLAHNITGFTNPLVCTRNLALGANQLSFVFSLQGAACQ
jgi:hypothetical protein